MEDVVAFGILMMAFVAMTVEYFGGAPQAGCHSSSRRRQYARYVKLSTRVNE